MPSKGCVKEIGQQIDDLECRSVFRRKIAEKNKETQFCFFLFYFLFLLYNVKMYL